MEETKTAIVPESVATPQDDLEAKLALLEAEKNKAIEESANYKLAFLKEKSRAKVENETEEERIARIVKEQVAEAKIAQIDTEKEALLKKALKENKELKLAQLNKPPTPASTSVHSEGQKVTDTSVTPEQLAAFKAKGWTDKDIERYKKNLQKYGGR